MDIQQSANHSFQDSFSSYYENQGIENPNRNKNKKKSYVSQGFYQESLNSSTRQQQNDSNCQLFQNQYQKNQEYQEKQNLGDSNCQNQKLDIEKYRFPKLTFENGQQQLGIVNKKMEDSVPSPSIYNLKQQSENGNQQKKEKLSKFYNNLSQQQISKKGEFPSNQNISSNSNISMFKSISFQNVQEQIKQNKQKNQQNTESQQKQDQQIINESKSLTVDNTSISNNNNNDNSECNFKDDFQFNIINKENDRKISTEQEHNEVSINSGEKILKQANFKEQQNSLQKQNQYQKKQSIKAQKTVQIVEQNSGLINSVDNSYTQSKKTNAFNNRSKKNSAYFQQDNKQNKQNLQQKYTCMYQDFSKKEKQYDLLRSLKLLSKIRLAVIQWYQYLPTQLRYRFTQNQHEIVNDKASFYYLRYFSRKNQDDNINNLINQNPNIVKINRQQESTLIKIPLFFMSLLQPFSTTLDHSNILSILAHCLNCFLTLILNFLYQICIFHQENLGANQWFQYILIISIPCYIFHILVNLNTAIYTRGCIVNDKKKIALHYWKNQFRYDMIGLISVLVNNTFSQTNFTVVQIAGVIFMIKLKSLNESFKILEQLIYLFGDVSHYYSLFKMLSNTLILCHWIGLLWHSLAIIEIHYLDDNSTTWLHHSKVVDDEWYVRYIYSFYWSASTMMLVGPVANNYIEIAFTTVILFATVAVFAYILNTISSIIFDLNKSKQIYVQDFKSVNKFMKQKQITKELQGRIRNYLDYYYESHSSLTQNEEINSALDKLPKFIKTDLFYEINSKRMSQFDKITKLFSNQTKNQLTSKFQEISNLPTDIIYKEGYTEDNQINLYWIKEGQVNLQVQLENGQHKILKVCKKGDIIGDYSFFTGKPPQNTAQCETNCQFYKINRKTFLEIIQQNSDDLEKYKQISEEILFKGTSSLTYQSNKCIICQFDHQFFNCPQIFYVCSKRRLVAINNRIYFQDRKSHQRRQDSFQTLSQIDLLMECYNQCFQDQEMRMKMLEICENYNENSQFYVPDYEFEEYQYQEQEYSSDSKNKFESETSIDFQVLDQQNTKDFKKNLQKYNSNGESLSSNMQKYTSYVESPFQSQKNISKKQIVMSELERDGQHKLSGFYHKSGSQIINSMSQENQDSIHKKFDELIQEQQQNMYNSFSSKTIGTQQSKSNKSENTQQSNNHQIKDRSPVLKKFSTVVQNKKSNFQGKKKQNRKSIRSESLAKMAQQAQRQINNNGKQNKQQGEMRSSFLNMIPIIEEKSPMLFRSSQNKLSFRGSLQDEEINPILQNLIQLQQNQMIMSKNVALKNRRKSVMFQSSNNINTNQNNINGNSNTNAANKMNEYILDEYYKQMQLEYQFFIQFEVMKNFKYYFPQFNQRNAFLYVCQTQIKDQRKRNLKKNSLQSRNSRNNSVCKVQDNNQISKSKFNKEKTITKFNNTYNVSNYQSPNQKLLN